MSLPKITVAHSGKQHSYHVALAMKRLGVLDRFYTSSYLSQKGLQKLFRNNSFLQKRFLQGLDSDWVESNWRFEFNEHWVRYSTKDANKVREAVYARDVHFDQYMARKLKKINSNVFWGFQGSCKESLKAANKFGKVSVCELATGHVTKALEILNEESKLHPEWAHTIDNLRFSSAYESRLREEPHIAQLVVAASDFTRETLIADGVDPVKVDKIPLGFDLSNIQFNAQATFDNQNRGLKLLYAGRITQRKGIKYLLEAIKKIGDKDIQLHIIGNKNNAEEALKPYKDCYTYHGAMAQQQLFEQYNNYDALVLPTIFEGFGLVIVEAMAAGLPVITTTHSIGPDIIDHGDNGYITPVRDVDALQKAILSLAECDVQTRFAMRESARKAALNFSWESYTTRLKEVLDYWKL